MSDAFLFDLDGTLIDSRRTIAAACNHALEIDGRPAIAESAIAGFVGDGARTLLARASGLGSAPEKSHELDALLRDFVRYYAAHPLDGTTWMPGARDALDRLGDARVGLVTNKAREVTESILRALGVVGRFGVVVAGGDGPLKPDPAPILFAVRALGATPEHTWVVGDGVQDVRAGKAAGCRTAAVLGGFHSEGSLRAEGPDVLLGSLSELAAATAGWRSPA